MAAVRTMRAGTDSRELKQPFVIARETIERVDSVVVELEQDGHRGRGEAVPQLFLGQSIAGVMAQLEQLRTEIEGGATRQDLLHLLPACSARNALDCALWDLEAKSSGRSVWDLAGRPAPDAPLQGDQTIGIGSPDWMQSEAARFDDFELLKVKLNGELVIERLRAVKRGAPAARLIVDVNEAWTFGELQQYAPQLGELGVELIEQPLPRGADRELLGYSSPVPLAADESCHDRSDLSYLQGRYAFVNIKLEKTGGLTEALRLADAAGSMGFRLMTGCMVASSLAIAPAFIVASLSEYRDLDGPSMLKEDRNPPVRVESGLIYPFSSVLWG
jgi:L-alanine-DL-glutamate epimerase-like enolase superfamily enzyme